MFKQTTYEKCLCLLFLVILLLLSCSAFRTDSLLTLTPHPHTIANTAPAVSNVQFNSELIVTMHSDKDKALWEPRRRRHARRRRPRRPRFCPGQDVATRSYRAHVVVEGQVRSKSSPRQGAYNVTVEVKHIHRPSSNDALYRALNLTDLIRLKFANRQHKGCEDRRVHGLVPARLSNGHLYVFFLESVGLHNYTVLGQPVPMPADPKQRRAIDKQIRDVLIRKKVKPAKIVSVKSSNTNVTFNENVTVTCEVRGNPPPVITWHRNGTELRRRKPENIRIKHQERNSTLLIQNFSWQDVATYECRAKGVIGKPVSRTVTISHSLSSEGTECDSPSKEHYCLNKGVCVRFKSLEEIACKCSTGFTGMRCENKEVSSQTSTYSRSQTCTLGLSNTFYC